MSILDVNLPLVFCRDGHDFRQDAHGMLCVPVRQAGENPPSGQDHAQGVQVHGTRPNALYRWSVFDVAQHGMPQARQLHSDLMRPAREQADQQQAFVLTYTQGPGQAQGFQGAFLPGGGEHGPHLFKAAFQALAQLVTQQAMP